jgi:hypothetical protein
LAITALLAFLELKDSHLHIVSILNKQGKPRNILMRVCLLLFGQSRTQSMPVRGLDAQHLTCERAYSGYEIAIWVAVIDFF